MEQHIRMARTRDDAVTPNVAHEGEDVGLDLTLVGVRRWEDGVTVYRTGWSATPPPGFHLELHAHSSVCNKGYMLANSVGIIERGYTGEILVALHKFDDSKPDLKLPFKAARLVLRRTHRPDFRIVDRLPDAASHKINGGFGSSDACTHRK